MIKTLFLACICLVCNFLSASGFQEQQIREIEMFGLFELSVSNKQTYSDPLRDVELRIDLTTPDGRILNHYGFFDGVDLWKIRFSPFIQGVWKYEYWFSDSKTKTRGEFRCRFTGNPGMVGKNQLNPFWLGRAESKKTLFRSFHAGDRFFASNWDDPEDQSDGNFRARFLDWLQQTGYNMLSIASHYTNRDEAERGKGWDTPDLWPPDPAEYRKMEQILNELQRRNITVFPFAGFFGAKGNWPTAPEEQELYIKYTLARIGHYPNTILTIGGPEPFWRKDQRQYKGNMRLADILRLGKLIDSLDIHEHILTVHNEKRATENGDPFIDENWYDMSSLQGPTTIDPYKLYSGLSMNHHRYKPAYAQETLWAGNMYHPDYTDNQLRKNAYTILFSGSVLNFADMKGNSSTGFSGTLDPADCNKTRHDLIKKVWDWFETIPFHQMVSRQDLVKQGFCLAREGVEYFVYLDKKGELELFLDFPYMLDSEWINAENPADVRPGDKVNRNTVFKTPTDGDDWILHVWASKPARAGEGNFPDIATDKAGNIHIVYNRSGLRYRKYSASLKEWSKEELTGCSCAGVVRSDPDIVIDSKGDPHVFCGSEYARKSGGKWEVTATAAKRDTELAIDENDNLYLVHRGGNNGGFIGLITKGINGMWKPTPDPDKLHKGSNNHVYCDLAAGRNNVLHLVQRHGPEVEVTYRRSDDGGRSWTVEEPVSADRAEAPHIAVGLNGKVYISTGSGYLYERLTDSVWKNHGQKVRSFSRMQPELSVDMMNNLYLTSFGGRMNTLYKGYWIGEKIIDPVSADHQIGFVETAGYGDYAFIIWEEGSGNADEGMGENSGIYVGILFPDGRIIGF
jgi:hypothetical protein